jgi:hypothetical protein
MKKGLTSTPNEIDTVQQGKSQENRYKLSYLLRFFKEDTIYVVQLDGTVFTSGYNHLEGIPLRCIPFDSPGYNNYRDAYAPDPDHVLFCEADNPKKLHCIHYTAVRMI